MERKISVDSGKFETKACMRRVDGSNKEISFRTKVDVMEAGARFMLNPALSHVVVVGDQRYIVGDAASTSDVKETSKKSLVHKVAVSTAIAMLVDNGDEVDVAMGCPLSIFCLKDKAQEYRDYILTRGEQVSLEIDGVKKSFIVKSVTLMPEGAGPVLLHPKQYGHDICGVIDIGGLNTNCAIYNCTYPVLSSMVTNTYGGNFLKLMVRRRLQALLDTDLMEEILEADIRRGYDLGAEKESGEIIAACKQAQVEKILSVCLEMGWNIRSMPLIFTGGSSYLLRDEIARQVPSVKAEEILEDVKFVNARGFLRGIAGGGEKA